MNTDKILALASYVRCRDGDALASPAHRAYMVEMSEWLESVVVDMQKQHLEYLHENHHPDDRYPPDEITDPIFVEYWKYRNEREDLKKYQSIFDCPEQEPNYWAIEETADEWNNRNRIS